MVVCISSSLLFKDERCSTMCLHRILLTCSLVPKYLVVINNYIMNIMLRFCMVVFFRSLRYIAQSGISGLLGNYSLENLLPTTKNILMHT